MSRIVVALGGNALGNTPDEQINQIRNVIPSLVDLMSEGHEVVITHGNGPQVGQINLSFENSAKENITPDMPFAECGSMSQGYIGYHIQKTLNEVLQKRGIKKDVLTIITEVLVSKDDKAFSNPTKPIGSFYTKEEALVLEKKGYKMVEDSGRGFRRVVPSPKPIDILEKNAIVENLEKDNVVIAVGGGGIPVIKEKDELKGVAAVIDKDLSSALLAREINADILLILTAVDKVYINYNKENQMGLKTLTREEALKYIKEGQFAKGSMLPKIEACLEFIKNNNKKAIITSIENASRALRNEDGTIIKEG